MRYVITGGAGFIGLNLVAALVARGGADIAIVDNLSNSTLERLTRTLAQTGHVEPVGGAERFRVHGAGEESAVSFRVGDIRDADLAVAAVRGADAVIHLAAQTGVPGSLLDPRADFEHNVLGTFNYLEACRINGVERFIGASSAAVLGDAPPPQREDGPSRPCVPYGASKSAAESYMSAYARGFGLRTLPLRFSNVYGPFSWSKGSVVASFCKRILEGRPMAIFGSGEQVRDFLHVADIVDIILRLIPDDRACVCMGEPLNVATGVRTRVDVLAGMLRDAFAELSIRGDIAFEPARRGDVLRSEPDTSRLAEILPDFRFTSLRDGLGKVVEWFAKGRGEAA